MPQNPKRRQPPRWCWSVQCRKCSALPGQTCVTTRGKQPTQSHAVRMNDAASPWGQNDVQFPRLLGEIYAMVQFTPEQEAVLCSCMDLKWDDVCEILERADAVWQAIKNKTGRHRGR